MAAKSVNLKYQARCLAAQPSDERCSRWLAGTTALREQNELQRLEHGTERGDLRVVGTWAHAGELWHIAACPADQGLAATVYNTGQQSCATVWRLAAELQPAAQLPTQAAPFRQVLWATAQQDQLASIEAHGLRTWALRDGEAQESGTASAGEMLDLVAGSWDPHDPSRIVTAGNNGFQAWDLRSMAQSGAVEAAHAAPVRDVDLSRHQQHLAVTGSDDGQVRMWDLRKLGSAATPLLELADHRHWVWQARFSPHHSQLILSSSSDCSVRVTHLAALPKSFAGAGAEPGAAPLVRQPTGAQAGQGPSSHSIEEHEDSVYGVAWSASDPWTFASLSYDGRLVVSQVPSQIKYKILI